MNLILTIAKASEPNRRERTISALGMGVFELTATELPLSFQGALIAIASTSSSDEIGKHSFRWLVEDPLGRENEIATGTMTFDMHPGQVLMDQRFGLLIHKPGQHVFRFVVGDREAVTALLVAVDKDEKGPK